jgi:hypothetical protein
MQEKLDNDDKA